MQKEQMSFFQHCHRFRLLPIFFGVHFYIFISTLYTDNTQFKMNTFILFKYTDFVDLKCCKQNWT